MVQEKRNYADLPGVVETLKEVSRAYHEYGFPPACFLSEECTVTLPVELWATFGYTVVGTATFTVGQAVVLALHTVPTDERAIVDGILLVRETGDNNVIELTTLQPSDYGDGDRSLVLIRRAAASAIIFWPDLGGSQTLGRMGPQTPVLLEPGAILRVESDGSGASGSTFRYEISLRRTKLFRASPP